MERLVVVNGPTAVQCIGYKIEVLEHEHDRLTVEQRQIERQFVEDDMVVTAGARKGQPLGRSGRRQRVNYLLHLGPHSVSGGRPSNPILLGKGVDGRGLYSEPIPHRR